jgi:hypothetical protein
MKRILTMILCCVPLLSFADFLIADNNHVNDSLVSLKDNGYIVTEVKREDGIFIIKYNKHLPNLPPPGASLKEWNAFGN